MKYWMNMICLRCSKKKAKNRGIMNGTARISWVMTLMRIQYYESWMYWKKLNQS